MFTRISIPSLWTNLFLWVTFFCYLKNQTISLTDKVIAKSACLVNNNNNNSNNNNTNISILEL